MEGDMDMMGMMRKIMEKMDRILSLLESDPADEGGQEVGNEDHGDMVKNLTRPKNRAGEE